MSNENKEPSLEETIRVQQAFLKAKAEYAAQEEERKKRIYEQAVKAAEEKKLNDSDYQARLAWAIAEAVEDYIHQK